MIPIIKVEFSEVFADTRFFVELNKVLFGAEVAMMHAGVDAGLARDIKNKIARSAFSDMDLDYAGIFNAASAGPVSSGPALESPQPQESEQAEAAAGETYEPAPDTSEGPPRSPFINQPEDSYQDLYEGNGGEPDADYITE